MSATFMSVTDLAAARGVSKQAISKTLKRHPGQVPTRTDGVRLMVDVEAFDRISGNETDPSQALRNRDREPPPLPAAAAAPAAQAPRSAGAIAQQAFSVNRAKREHWDAELSRIALEKELGKLVPVTAVTDAMVACGQKLVRIIEQLPSKSEDPVVRKILKDAALELRTALYESMKVSAEEGEAEFAEEGDDEAA